jgi:hypothetical protein
MMNNSIETMLSKTQLLLAIVLSLIIGAAVTFLFVLPMENTINNSESGVSDSLANEETELQSQSTQNETVETLASEQVALYISIDPETTQLKINEFGESQAFVEGVNIRSYDQEFKTESIDVLIDVGAQVEFKAIMETGEVLLYAWEANDELYYDFHAHQENGNPDFWTRYAEGEGTADKGSIVAPYQGEHGWYWLNISDNPVSVKLRVAGYYREIKEIDL